MDFNDKFWTCPMKIKSTLYTGVFETRYKSLF